MATILIVIGAVVAILGTVVLLSFLGGTILYWVWPVTMVNVFHLPALTWWQSVCLVWVFGLLIKSTQTNNNK